MRILIDARHLRDFGFGTYTRNLVRSLARHDASHEYLIVVHPKDAGELAGLPANFRLIPYERTDQERMDHLTFPALVRSLRPSLSHIPLNMVPLFMPRPYVVTVHDLSSLIYDKRAGWRHDLHFYRIRRGLSRAARILAVSAATARDISSLLRIPADRTRIVYGAPDPQFTTAAASPELEQERERVMERYQVNSPFLLYSGTVRPQKNLPRLVEAFALVKSELDQHPQYRDLRLLIIGDEVSKAPAVRQAVMQAHVAHAVRFLGFVPLDTLRVFYQAATAFVFPSLYEGFGLPPLEAMASGVPVIASNTSSLPEVVGEAAVTVDPENVFDIARGIKDVLLDPDLQRRLIASGYEQVARFDWDRTAKEVLETYASLGIR